VQGQAVIESSEIYHVVAVVNSAH